MANASGYNGGRFYSQLVKPVLVDCSFVVDPANTNGLGVSSLIGSGIRNVFMHTSSTPGSNLGYLNPNPAVGFALVQFKVGYSRYAGGFNGVVCPNSGSSVAINATALTAHNPYIINAVGAGPNGAVTIAPVADVSGSLASTWFSLYDNYGNTFIIWFSVAGVGSAPKGVGGILVQQSIASGATAAQIGTALVTTIAALPSGISGVFSFTASGTTTVTVTATKVGPLAGPPAEGLIATGFTFATTVSATNLICWQGVGLPKGLTPTIGQSFIATTTGYSTLGSSSGTVMVPGISGIGSVELVGNPNTTVYTVPQGGSASPGGWAMIQFLAPTNSSTTTPIATAPATNSVVSLAFYMEQSSVLIAGE